MKLSILDLALLASDHGAALVPSWLRVLLWPFAFILDLGIQAALGLVPLLLILGVAAGCNWMFKRQ